MKMMIAIMITINMPIKTFFKPPTPNDIGDEKRQLIE